MWSDELAPAALLYGQREPRAANWDWSLNTVDCRLIALSDEGQVQVQLDTETPGWKSYEAELNGQRAELTRHEFPWKLQPGKNLATVRSRNLRGRLGPAAKLSLEYTP